MDSTLITKIEMSSQNFEKKKKGKEKRKKRKGGLHVTKF